MVGGGLGLVWDGMVARVEVALLVFFLSFLNFLCTEYSPKVYKGSPKLLENCSLDKYNI